ncbi:MAG: aminopeptidase P family protein [Hyphomicrobiales bacterium]|nr:aminopeptidase P family protein [Hyphomicrobiales bacterium]
MYQKFEDIGGSAHSAERLQSLRAALKRLSLTGFMLPRSDEFQNEFVAADAEQLLWLTGFSGSWGEAVILEDRAGLVIDGRYELQASKQIDVGAYDLININRSSLSKWLGEHLKAGDRLGYDPRLHTVSQVERLGKIVAAAKAELVAVEPNPLAELWTDRPASKLEPISLQPLEFAGVSANDKILDIQNKLVRSGSDAVVIGPLDSIAWLFNIRGRDLPHTPFVIAYAMIPAAGKARLFIDGRKLTSHIRHALSEVAIIAEPSERSAYLSELGKQKAVVQLDSSSVSQWYLTQLKHAGATIRKERDPCTLPKARKNDAEVSGARAAHLRDGVAVSRFLAWFEKAALPDALDEISVARRLEEFRRESNLMRDISFDTIAAAGPNGAIVHYRPTFASNRKIEAGSLFLIDSGAQYNDGTTDLTRTLAVGTPTGEMRRHYTLVLKGHIALATARFPEKTRGSHIDAFARRPLWEAGLDFDHGTGHGVGSFLSVHEGPQSISRRDSAALEAGMIVSNEPGFYREGEYGIRIENLLLVTPLEDIPGGERPMMGFETLTLAPYDRALIDKALLRNDEIAWIDAYHQRVFGELGEQVDDETRTWLGKATAALRRPDL